jgi:2-polyprenyl-3-methyl-5-hydroxy-6-metoxy-1,4-benzoquinol methylase
MVYLAFNQKVFLHVPASAKIILDVGCGTGEMGKELRTNQKERIVYGITYLKKEYDIAAKLLNKVWLTDINSEEIKIDTQFDCIIFSHVLEHTYKPEAVLKYFSRFLKDEGLIIVALPNILYYKQRVEFLKGRFRYTSYGGLMDSTHFRFFDWETAQEMITNTGLKIISKETEGNFPLLFFRNILPSLSRKIDLFAQKKWPGLFGFQFVFVAKK